METPFIPGALQQAPINATKPTYFLWGSYRSNHWTVPFFTANLTLEDAADYLNVASEIPSADEGDWHIEELYQREIDWRRVNNIVSYLRADSVKFFNALTVVLLPKKADNGVFATQFKVEETWNAPDRLQESYPEEFTIGPIRFGFFGSVRDASGHLDVDSPNLVAGQVSWNRDEVTAVAIDGQHRLAAIKTLRDAPAGQQSVLKSRVPVLFLLFHEGLGFKSQIATESASLLRDVFIDLNQHAKTVARARQILLDDRDPQAVCVRSIIADSLMPTLSSLNASPARLPLSLVDWHSEENKFDSGPYLTTILNLDWIVMKLLDTRELRSYIDYGKVKTQIFKLQTKLKVNLGSALERLKELEVSQRPFAYEPDELQQIRSNFSEIYGKTICDLISKFAPLENFIALRDSVDSIRVEWQHWFRLNQMATSQTSVAYQKVELAQYHDELLNRIPPINTDDFVTTLTTIENMKKHGGLEYTVVFQKAMVDAFADFCKVELAALTNFALNPPLDDVKGDGAGLALSAGEEVSFGEDFDFDDDFDDDEFESLRLRPQAGEVLGEKARIEGASEAYLAALNKLFYVGSPILKLSPIKTDSADLSEFWRGSLLKEVNTIDPADAAAGRARDLLITGVFLAYLKNNCLQQTEYEAFDDLWLELIDNDNNSYALVKKLRLRIKSMTKSDKSIAARILDQRGVDFDEDKAMDLIREKLSQMWSLL